MMTAGTKAVPAPAAKQRSQGRRGVLRELSRHRALYAMMLPGLLGFFIINYIPMGGAVIAFQDYNPVQGIFGSEFNGFENFRFFFESNSAVTVTVNTICYNLLFMVLGIGLGMFSAILISQLQQKRAAAFYKSVIFLPYLISWVVAAYLLFAILSVDKGILNWMIEEWFGGQPVQWYSVAGYWYVILPLAYVWKNAGYFAVIFYAGITGISMDLYEAAEVDGAGKLRQMISITVPSLMPLVLTLFLLQAGKIFFAAFGDWGLFYNLPMQSGVLYTATDVIDTYVYNSLRKMNDFGMSTAVGLYQSVVGCVLVLVSNWAVRRYDKESAIF